VSNQWPRRAEKIVSFCVRAFYRVAQRSVKCDHGKLLARNPGGFKGGVISSNFNLARLHTYKTSRSVVFFVWPLLKKLGHQSPATLSVSFVRTSR